MRGFRNERVAITERVLFASDTVVRRRYELRMRSLRLLGERQAFAESETVLQEELARHLVRVENRDLSTKDEARHTDAKIAPSVVLDAVVFVFADFARLVRVGVFRQSIATEELRKGREARISFVDLDKLDGIVREVVMHLVAMQRAVSSRAVVPEAIEAQNLAIVLEKTVEVLIERFSQLRFDELFHRIHQNPAIDAWVGTRLSHHVLLAFRRVAVLGGGLVRGYRAPLGLQVLSSERVNRMDVECAGVDGDLLSDANVIDRQISVSARIGYSVSLDELSLRNAAVLDLVLGDVNRSVRQVKKYFTVSNAKVFEVAFVNRFLEVRAESQHFFVVLQPKRPRAGSRLEGLFLDRGDFFDTTLFLEGLSFRNFDLLRFLRVQERQ